MKAVDPEHLRFAKMRDFNFRCDPRLFSDEQYELIRRWGHWYQALTDGTLEPFTDAQLDFIAAVRDVKPPNETHAAAWWRYCKRLKIEEKHGEAMHSSYQIDADTFYNRDMVKHVRKTMFNVINKEHRR